MLKYNISSYEKYKSIIIIYDKTIQQIFLYSVKEKEDTQSVSRKKKKIRKAQMQLKTCFFLSHTKREKTDY